MSMKSSRSHAIFTLTLESRKKSSNGKLLTSKINLCDLAGSERLQGNYNINSLQVKEMKKINLSLMTLGRVINSLSENVNKLKILR